MKRHRLSDLEQEAQEVFYLVELIWNDGIKTGFVVRSSNRDYALHAVEAKALSMYEGYITSNRVEVIPIPEAPNLPEQVYTDHSGYREEVNANTARH